MWEEEEEEQEEGGTQLPAAPGPAQRPRRGETGGHEGEGPQPRAASRYSGAHGGALPARSLPPLAGRRGPWPCSLHLDGQ